MIGLLTLTLIAATPLSQWPRMRADAFGCMLENEHGHKDATFNCAMSGYVNKGDPCTNTAAYYEGPSVPARLVTGARDVRAEWEHGELRALHITLTGVLLEKEAKQRLSLPATLPPNIMRIDVQACAKDATCVTLEGFEHQGAGDVECPPAVESLCEPNEQLLFTCQRAASKPVPIDCKAGFSGGLPASLRTLIPRAPQ